MEMRNDRGTGRDGSRHGRRAMLVASSSTAATPPSPSSSAASPSPSAPSGGASDADVVSRDTFVELSVYRLLVIFLICSVAGLIVETLVSYPIDGRWKNRAGFLWGPLSPIYGVGAVLMTVLLNHLKNAHPVKLFVCAAVLGGGFELLAGWFFENAFGIVAWSYADQPFNIGGYTCLGIALCWGALGLAWMKLLLPVALRIADAVPQRARHVVTVAGLVFVLLDAVMTLTAFDCWFERQAGQPIETPVQMYFAERYGDEFMAERFQTMSLWTDLADARD